MTRMIISESVDSILANNQDQIISGVKKNALYVQDLEAGYFLGTDNPIRRNLLMVRF